MSQGMAILAIIAGCALAILIISILKFWRTGA